MFGFSRFLLNLALAVLFFTPAVSGIEWPDFLLYQKNGISAEANFGTVVAAAGDLQADGKQEFIVGAPYESPGGIRWSGSATVYSGAGGTVLYRKSGTQLVENFGFSAAAAGDVNGDGLKDFIVGAINTNNDSAFINSTGSVYVYSGAYPANLLYHVFGGATLDRFGWSVAGIGDVNADGKSDFIVGAPTADPGGRTDAGSAFVYSGADASLLYRKDGVAAGDQFGNTVAGVGDVNGDGKPDFAVGAFLASPSGYLNAGSAYVYSGADGSLIYEKHGAAPYYYFGQSVAGCGDVNADGAPDFIVGAPRATGNSIVLAGAAYIYSGATGSLLLEKGGPVMGSMFGYSVAGGTDANGDGRPDVIIGADWADPGGLTDAGAAYVYSGVNGGLLNQKFGGYPDDDLGISVAGLGDLDGDGKGEFIVGAYRADIGDSVNAGSAYVIAGKTRAVSVASIKDVPNDQGGQVRLKWRWLPANDPDLDLFIIYRRIDGAALALAGRIPSGPEALALPPGNWEIVASVPASGDTTYATIVPTAVDSTSGGTRYSVYFVRGRSTQPNLFLDSPADSGYSVDNLAPASPSNLTVVPTGADLFAAWSGGGEADFSHFNLYRDTSASMADKILLDTVSASYRRDRTSIYGKTYYYDVTAVDRSGNEGPPSNVASATMAVPRKGDLNLDGLFTPSDAVLELNFIFLSAAIPAPASAADVNCDGNSTPSDAVVTLNAIFLGAAFPCGY